MVGEMHDVVQLLLARMETNPEEFGGDDPRDEYIHRTENDRWWQARELAMEFGTEEEKAALRLGMRKLKLKVAHEWMLDELLNGPERRAQEERDRARYANNMGASLRGAITPALQKIDAQMQQKALQAQMGMYQQAMSNTTTDPNLLNAIKKALGK